MKLKTVLCLAAFAAIGNMLQAEGLKNLPETKSPRIKVSDRVWSKIPGDAYVCFWKDDKLMPITLTVDDNSAPDHQWWMEMAEKYGLKVTWFVITSRIGDNPNSYFGTWEGFKKLLDAGHDIQTHTVSHLDNDKLTIVQEYADSKAILEEKFPGHKVLAVAYPGGKNSKKNSIPEASKIFISGRGGRGIANQSDRINYMETCSLSGYIPFNQQECRWVNVEDCLNPKSRGFRNWMCIHYHGVNKPEQRAKAEAAFQKLKEMEKDIWVGTFVQVTQYGQERDTAELKVTKNTPSEIAFNLTDKMDDTLFNFPLTVKVCVPSDWSGAEALQNQKPVACEIQEKDGAKYVFVQAVPDAGEVTIRKK